MKTTVINYFVNGNQVFRGRRYNDEMRAWEFFYQALPEKPRDMHVVETVRGEAETCLDSMVLDLDGVYSVMDIERREVERLATAQEIQPDIDDMDTEDILDMLPTHKVVCPRCHGTGSHDPEAWSDGFTASEFNEMFETPEEQADYFNGRYDVSCTECGGNNVVDDVDPDRLNETQEILYNYVLERYRFDHECRLEQEAERRMGC